MANNIEVQIRADSSNAERAFERTSRSARQMANGVGEASSRSGRLGPILQQISSALNRIDSNLGKATASMQRFGNSANDAGNKVKNANKQVNQMGAALQAFASTKLAGAMLSVGESIVQMGASSVMAAAQMRQYEIAFQTMLKSTSQGTQMLKDLQQFAATTPFDVPGVVQAGQQLMAFGFQANEIIPMLTSLGDAASGLGKGTAGVGQLAYALGQMQTSGKLNAQDMMQLTNAGIAAWDMLAKASGKTVMEIKDLCSKGAIDSKEAVKIIIEGVNQQFGGMMNKTSEEVSGLMANIEETVGTTSAVVGKYMIDAFNIKGVLKNVSDQLGDFQQKMQDAADKGMSFRDVIKDCVPPGVVVALGAVAGLMAGAFAASIYVAVTGLGVLCAALTISIGTLGLIVGAFVAVGAAVVACVVYWDELVDGVKYAVNYMLDVITAFAFGAVAALGVLPQKALELLGSMWEKATGFHNNWFTDLAEMLDKAIKAVADWGNKAIAWFDKVFERKPKVMDDEYWRLSMANTDDDNNDGNSDIGIPKTKGSLIMDPQKTDKALQNEAVKQLQFENKINQERLKSKNSYDKQVLAKTRALKEAEYALTKKFGTDAEKLDVELKMLELDRTQAKLKEQMSYQEQYSAQENAIKEAQLKGADQKELDMMREKLALLTKTHNEAMKTIDVTYDSNKLTAQTEYDVNQAEFNAKYGQGGTADTVDALNAQNEKKYQERLDAAKQDLELRKQITKEYEAEKARIEAINKVQQMSNQLALDFSSAITSWITGAKSFGSAMQSVLSNLIVQLMQAAIYAMILASLGIGGAGSFAGNFNKGFGGFFGVGKAKGGPISGPGTSTSDDIPAMLSDGEYVINAEAVDRLGVPFLNGLNSGRIQGFATGGLVGASGSYRATERATGSADTGNNIVLNVSAIDASGFSDFLSRGGGNVLAQYTKNLNRNFSTDGVW